MSVEAPREEARPTLRDVVIREIDAVGRVRYVGESSKLVLPKEYEGTGLPIKDFTEKVAVIVAPVYPTPQSDFQTLQDELRDRLVAAGLQPRTHDFEEHFGGLKLGRITMDEFMGDVEYTITPSWPEEHPHIQAIIRENGLDKSPFFAGTSIWRSVSQKVYVRLYPAEIAEEILRYKQAVDKGLIDNTMHRIFYSLKKDLKPLKWQLNFLTKDLPLNPTSL